MDNMFSSGEIAKLRNISKQTLLFYDKIGLFKPGYVDSENGYRYYSAEQLDYLDTILIMKKVGFPLGKIKKHLEEYSTKDSLEFLKEQIEVIDKNIDEWNLLKNRLEHRCEQVEDSLKHKNTEPEVGVTDEFYILQYDVEKPYSMEDISIATKKCYSQALSENIPIFFQCGVCVPFEHIQEGRHTEATTAFVTSEKQNSISNIKKLPAGMTVNTYHFGNYYDIKETYDKIIDYCKRYNLKIISDSYEFCINDYITSKNEDEFITKVMFYIG